MDDSLQVYPLGNRNKNKISGCIFIGTERNERQKADVFIFNNPYLKTNIDVVFIGGKLYISDPYGESIDRNTLFYVPIH